MVEDLRSASKYLRPLADSFWQWRDDGDVLSWRDGTTIAFRPEVAAVLSSLAPTGLPSLGAVALVLAACRDTWTASAEELGTLLSMHFYHREGDTRHDLVRDVSEGLARVRNLPRELRQPLPARGVLFELIFQGTRTVVPREHAADVLALLESRVPEEITTPAGEWAYAIDALVRDLKFLRIGLARVNAETLRLRLRTGLDELPIPVEEELPLAERVRALLKQLESDEELCGLARLAKQLMAAMTLPHALLDREDLPVGGVSDIVNRGPLDRLLLSELAHDDLTLAVRVALGEALYLRRESPPRTPPRQRALLLETGIRSWGVPRVFATAVAMALAATDDHHSEVVALRARGRVLEPVDLATREGLVTHLAALDCELHPGAALDAFQQHVAGESGAAEPVLITTDDVLDDHEFLNALAAAKLAPLLVTTVNRAGVMRLIGRTARGTKLIREAQLDLADLLREPKRTLSSLIDRDAAGGLPAIFAVRFPLLLPHSIDAARIRHLEGHGALALTKDRRVMLWSTPGRGAEQLADEIPRYGPLHWISRPAGESLVYAAVGEPKATLLHLLQIDLQNRSCQSLPVEACAESHYCVCAHGGVLFLVGRTHVDIINVVSGQLIAKQAIPQGVFWQRDRFFRQGVTGPWTALSFNGMAAVWEPMLDERAKRCPLLLTMFERAGVEGPIAVTARGDLYSTATGNLRKVNHGCQPTVRVLAISADGQRIVLGSVGGSKSDILARRWVVDVETLVVHERAGDPFALADPLPSVIRSQSLRTRINRICVDVQGVLILLTRKQQLALDFDPTSQRIVLRRADSFGSYNGKKLGFKPVTTGGPRGYNLSVATWDDGSQAFLDSRGLLHLKSSDSKIPEVSIVLCDGMLSGWCSDGRMWGDPFFFGDQPAYPASDVFESCIRPFGRRLVA